MIFLFASSGATALFAQESTYIEGEVLVLMRGSSVSRLSVNDEESNATIQRRANSLSGASTPTTAEGFVNLSKGSGMTFALLRSETETTDEMITRLKDNPEVQAVSRNYVRHSLETTPNDPLFESTQLHMKSIGAPEVWSAGTGSNEVVVGIIDSGILYDHPDLKSNIYTFNRYFWPTPQDNVHGVWYSQNIDGGFSVIGVEDATGNNLNNARNIGDVNGHGTHIAGIIGAVGNNKTGVAGVNWQVKLLPVNVFSFTDGTKGFAHATDEEIIKGLDFLVEAKAQGINLRVVNLSLGGWNAPVDQGNDALGLAIKRLSDADVIVTIAAGNEYQDIDSPTGNYAGKKPYPASYKYENTITVGALEPSLRGYDQKARYTNYSSSGRWVDVFAPGSDIMSTVRFTHLMTSSLAHEFHDPSGYMTLSGTSMAAPIVAGSAALLCGLYPEKSANEIKSMLLYGANKEIAGTLSRYGALSLPGANAQKEAIVACPAPKVFEVASGVFKATGAALEVVNAPCNETQSLTTKAVVGEAAQVIDYSVMTSVIASLLEPQHIFYTPKALPIFRVSGESMQGKVYAIQFEVEGAALGRTIGEVRVAKVTDRESGKLFTFTNLPAEYQNGRFTLLDMNGGRLTGESLDAAKKYKLVLFVSDNGGFDIAGEADAIVNAAIAYSVQRGSESISATAQQPETSGGSEGSGGGGGGGGCAALEGTVLVFLLTGISLIQKRYKR